MSRSQKEIILSMYGKGFTAAEIINILSADRSYVYRIIRNTISNVIKTCPRCGCVGDCK